MHHHLFPLEILNEKANLNICRLLGTPKISKIPKQKHEGNEFIHSLFDVLNLTLEQTGFEKKEKNENVCGLNFFYSV